MNQKEKEKLCALINLYQDKHTPRLQISNLIGDGRFYSLRLIDEMKKNLCAKCNAGLIADFAKQTGITFD